jgi:hypothetical protein
MKLFLCALTNVKKSLVLDVIRNSNFEIANQMMAINKNYIKCMS